MAAAVAASASAAAAAVASSGCGRKERDEGAWQAKMFSSRALIATPHTQICWVYFFAEVNCKLATFKGTAVCVSCMYVCICVCVPLPCVCVSLRLSALALEARKKLNKCGICDDFKYLHNISLFSFAKTMTWLRPYILPLSHSPSCL